eukprot:5188875-Heterocapsa_arctica.AAC.1
MADWQAGTVAKFGAQGKIGSIIPGCPTFSLPHDLCGARVSLCPVRRSHLDLLAHVAQDGFERQTSAG